MTDSNLFVSSHHISGHKRIKLAGLNLKFFHAFAKGSCLNEIYWKNEMAVTWRRVTE